MAPARAEGRAVLVGPIDEDRTRFDVGYGLCLGHNEKKAIAMANLDVACTRDAGRSSLEQSVLLTTDGLDACGFPEHLKLPQSPSMARFPPCAPSCAAPITSTSRTGGPSAQ